MITPNQIRELLRAAPFRPFRIFLSDGSKHDVPHPEFGWVVSDSVFVGTAGKSNDMPEGAKRLSVLHITRIENLPKPKARA